MERFVELVTLFRLAAEDRPAQCGTDSGDAQLQGWANPQRLGSLSNPQPWKRRRNFWHALMVKRLRLRLRFQVAGCLFKVASVQTSRNSTFSR